MLHLVATELFGGLLGIEKAQTGIFVFRDVWRIPRTQGEKQLVNISGQALQLHINAMVTKALRVIHHVAGVVYCTGKAPRSPVICYLLELVTAVNENGCVQIVASFGRISPKQVKYNMIKRIRNGIQ